MINRFIKQKKTKSKQFFPYFLSSVSKPEERFDKPKYRKVIILNKPKKVFSVRAPIFSPNIRFCATGEYFLWRKATFTSNKKETKRNGSAHSQVQYQRLTISLRPIHIRLHVSCPRPHPHPHSLTHYARSLPAQLQNYLRCYSYNFRNLLHVRFTLPIFSCKKAPGSHTQPRHLLWHGYARRKKRRAGGTMVPFLSCFWGRVAKSMFFVYPVVSREVNFL